jgi:hypothetical protein
VGVAQGAARAGASEAGRAGAAGGVAGAGAAGRGASEGSQPACCGCASEWLLLLRRWFRCCIYTSDLEQARWALKSKI